MQIKVGEEMVEVDNSTILEGFRNEPDYNAEVDRIAEKRANNAALETKSTYEATLSQMKVDHEAELKAIQQVNSGKKSEETQGLTAQIETLTKTMNAFEQRANDAELKVKTSSLKSDLATAMADVSDEYLRGSHIKDAMVRAKVNGDTAQFELKTGAFGNASDMVAEIKSEFPQHFTSKQPNGNGINGGALTGVGLLNSALGGDMASKMAYVEQNGLPAYLAKVEEAALKTTQ